MNTESVDPQLRPALAKLPTLDNSRKLVRLIGRFGPRLMRTDPVPGVATRWVRSGPLRLRLYEPTRPPVAGPALLWIHGGGLVIGSAQQDDRLCLGTAGALGIPVISVEYRLAPEHPFPAALDDARDAWEWVQANAIELGIDPARVAVGGESAGAGIAASLVHRLHDENGVQPAAQWLFAPMLDDRTAARSELDHIDHPVWNNRANRFGWTAYLGREPGTVDVPAGAVPARRADLTGLPPTWIYSGDIELFYDEIVEYTDRLRTAGVEVASEVVPGAAHGFENWAHSTDLATGLVSRARAWLGQTLGVAAD